MSSEMGIALIGVIGTLAGTVLGWILTNISQRGKLNLYVSSFEETFTHQDNIGSFVSSSCIEEAEHYSFDLVFDIYNSSNSTKIMRNITVAFSSGRKTLLQVVPLDNDTRHTVGSTSRCNTVAPINIPAKSSIQLHLLGGIGKHDSDFNLIWETKKIYLTYSNEKNHNKKICIKKVSYCNYFDV